MIYFLLLLGTNEGVSLQQPQLDEQKLLQELELLMLLGGGKEPQVLELLDLLLPQLIQTVLVLFML